MWCTMHARVYSWILICDFRIPGSERGVCSVCMSVCVSGVFCVQGCVCACAFCHLCRRAFAHCKVMRNLVGCYITPGWLAPFAFSGTNRKTPAPHSPPQLHQVNARRIPSRACRRPSTSLSSHSLASIAAAACVLSPLTPPRNSNSPLTPRSRSAPLSWAHLGYTRLAQPPSPVRPAP